MRIQPTVLAIDGPSGVGKSTLLPLVQARLERRGLRGELVSNNETGPFATIIRALADSGSEPFSLALAVAGARAYMHESLAGRFLICDRHVLSTFAYQGYAGVPNDYLFGVNAPFLEGVILVALELSPSALARRRQGRSQGRGDWFKHTLSHTAEVDLFRGAVQVVREAGREVSTVSAAGASPEIADQVVEAVWPRLMLREAQDGR